MHIFPTTTTTTTTTTTPLGPRLLSQLHLPTRDCESVFDETRSEFRIIGGSSDDNILQSWPWMGNLNAECGAILISNRFALTAAHCCHHIESNKQSVFFGSSKLTDRDAMRADIESYKIHPDYQVEHFKNDICLIKFKEGLLLFL
jgi:secreted trypsin-like serine protease